MFLRIILCLLPFFVSAQSQYRFDRFTIKDGLSQNTVHCTLKDSEGYYWFGTQDGLNRYDGYAMKIYRHNRDDSTTISDNFILTILEDDNGNLWIGTRNGFNFMDKKSGTFKHIQVNEKEKNSYNNNIWNAVIDADGNILFSNHYMQLVKITHEDSKQQPFLPQVLREGTMLLRISPSSYGLINVETGKLEFYNVNDKSKKQEKVNPGFINAHAVLQTSSGKFLTGSLNGLSQLTENNILSTVLPGKIVNVLLEDSRKNIWVGTTTGLYVYEKGELKDKPVFITHSPADLHSPGSNNIQSVYEDDEGLVWIGTSEAGVSIYDPQKAICKIFNPHTGIALSGSSTWAIMQDGNELWVGTNNGLNQLIFENADITKAYSNENKVLSSRIFLRSDNYPNTICNDFISAVIKDKKDNIWIGTNDGISVFNPSSHTWQQINTTNSALKSDVIFHLMCAKDGKIWISTKAGLYVYTPNTKAMEAFKLGYVISTYEDRDSTIWVAATSGLYHRKQNGEPIANFKNKQGYTNSLSYSIVTCAYRDSNGRLWAGTMGGGINLYDEIEGSFRSFTQKDGLANDITYYIAEDKTGRLWISTNTGLSCFNPADLSFTNYTEKNGIPANEFIQNAGYVNTAGELFFGTPEGLLVFNPLQLTLPAADIPVLLTMLRVNYEPRLFSKGGPLNLYYGDKTVSFEFSAPDFQSQQKIHYAFQLEGFDEHWQNVESSNRLASYSNLPFGSYTFKVRVKRDNAPWQNNILAVSINVIPPFWLTPWFIAVVVVVMLTLIILFIKYYSQRRLKTRLREAELQQKIFIERERISRDLHDNVGAHLTYITTSLDAISWKLEKEEKNNSVERITTLSDFTRYTMQQLRETIWAINKEQITIDELKLKMQDYCTRMTAAGNIQFYIEVAEAGNHRLKPSHAINIYRIVQEAINNAVKHSQASQLILKLSEKPSKILVIEVIDNGNGMKNSLTNGHGIKNMHDRVSEMQGRIEIGSPNGKGTCIRISIPV